MPAIPIAESSAPIVVGINATSSAMSVAIGRVGVGELAERPQRHDGDEEDDRQPGEQDVERDLVRRLAAAGALHQADHAVEEDSARLLGDLDHDAVGEHARAAGDRAAVAARLADDRGRLAGDRRLVDGGDALDDRPVAGDRLARLDDHAVALGAGRRRAASPPSFSRATVSVRIARRVAACALPRPSASASARLAKTTVSHSHTATVKVNSADSSPPPSGCAAEGLDQPADRS